MVIRAKKAPHARRIVCDPAIFAGKPVIEGTRMSVEQILGLIAKGMSVDDVLEAYPVLNAADVRAALEYARASLSNDVVMDVRKR